MAEDNEMLNIGCYSSHAAIGMQRNSSSYYIIQVLWGFGAVGIAGQLYAIQPGSILFLRPCEKAEWRLGHDIGMHYCSVHPAYFSGHPHVLQMFADHFTKQGIAVLQQVPFGQIAAFSLLFRLIGVEVNGGEDDKKTAILIHLQMLLLLANRVYRFRGNEPHHWQQET